MSGPSLPSHQPTPRAGNPAKMRVDTTTYHITKMGRKGARRTGRFEIKLRLKETMVNNWGLERKLAGKNKNRKAKNSIEVEIAQVPRVALEDVAQ